MQLVKGNIFDSKCDVIVNPVNTVGVMGAGLALQFKNKYPDMYEHYKKCCSENKFKMGNLILFKNVLCFPTKEHWKNPSKLEYIDTGLKALKELVNDSNIEIKSIAFPLLGCGLGGLKKEDVMPLIENFEKETGIYCEVYGA